MIFGVRHGERADRDDKESVDVEINYDAHLTHLGVQQAQETGRFIQEKIDQYAASLPKQEATESQIQGDNGIRVIIVCSPFLRTLMTAYEIGRQVKHLYQNTIYIQEQLIENLSHWHYKSHPLNKLFIREKSLEELNNYIDFRTTKVGFGEPWLESATPLHLPEREFDKRVQTIVEELSLYYLKNYDVQKYVLVFVTHQGIIESALRHFQAPLKEDQYCDYCGVMQVSFKNPQKADTQDYEVLLAASTDHLTKL